jgi:5-hydroxyisourate hydrolase
MSRLTTHILDTAHGGPAQNVDIRLFLLGNSRELVVSATTNEDGRTPYPLLEDELMTTGTYELEFDIGAYFRKRQVELGTPAFLDTVVIRFAINGDEDYHVPLLASPWSYSTYRGS